MAQIFAAPFYTAISAAGNVVSGAKLYFFATGTLVPQATYQDAEMTTPHTHPVVADSAGRFPAIYLDDTLIYRAKLTESNDALIKDVDPVGPNGSASAGQANIKAFGAVGDGDSHPLSDYFDTLAEAQVRYPHAVALTDEIDWAAMQAAVDDLADSDFGGICYIPPGKYRINRTVDVIWTHTTDLDSKAINIQGAGSGMSTLLHYAGANVNLINMAPSGAAPVHSWTKWSGFTIAAPTIFSGRGIKALDVTLAMFEDIHTTQLLSHWDLEDTLSVEFIACRMRWGKYGLNIVGNGGSSTNALTFEGCHIGLMYENGISMSGGANFYWKGGSIEACGIDVSGQSGSATKGAVLMSEMGLEGGVAFQFEGVYFEGNSGAGEIRLTGNTNDVVGNISGNTFNKLSTAYPDHVVHITPHASDGWITINLRDNCFRSFGGYTPDAGRRVFYSATTTRYTFNDDGNFYSDLLEAPAEYATKPHATVTFEGATGTIFRQNGVVSVTRNSTGNYRVNLREPLKSTSPNFNAQAGGGFGICYGWNQGADWFEFRAANAAGTLIDPALLSLTLFD